MEIAGFRLPQRILFFVSLFLLTSQLHAAPDIEPNENISNKVRDSEGFFKETGTKVGATLPSSQSEQFYKGRWLVQFKPLPLAQYRTSKLSELLKNSKKTQWAAQESKLILDYQQQLRATHQSFASFVGQSLPSVKINRSFVNALNGVALEANELQVEKLRGHPAVKSILPSRRYQPLLQRSVQNIRAPQVWEKKDAQDRQVTGHGIKVAILDSGVDYSHPDLGGCFGEGCKVAGGYDFVNDDPDPMEDEDYYQYLGHGTHVAGIVAADGQVTGVAPDATIFAYKVCGINDCSDADILAALERSLDIDGDINTNDKVDVVNMSLGSSYGGPTDPVAVAINNVVSQGVVVVVSAGNDETFATIGEIASAENAITVAATDDKNASIVNFSSKGPVQGASFLKPDISAPGENIYSTYVNSWDPTYRYNTQSGTSMAAPHVAGAAALMLQHNKELSPKEIKTRMMNSAIAIKGVDRAHQGAGKLNVLEAVEAQLNGYPSALFFGQYQGETSTSNTQLITLTNDSDEPKELSLSFVNSQHSGLSFALNESNLSLDAGSSQQISISMNVDEGQFDPFNQPSLTASAGLVISDGNSELNVPLVLSTMADVEMDYGLNRPAHVAIFNEVDSNLFLTEDTQNSYFLPIGNYTFVATDFYSSDMRLVFKESESVIGSKEIAINLNNAKHQLSLDSALDENGKKIDLTSHNAEFIVEYVNPNSKFFGAIGISPRFRYRNRLLSNSILFSDVSDDVEIRVAGVMASKLTNSDDIPVFYTLGRRYQGVDSDIAIDFDASNSKQAQLTIGDRYLNGSPGKLELSLSSFTRPGYGSGSEGHLGGFSGSGSGYYVEMEDVNGEDVFQEGVIQAKIFMDPTNVSDSFDVQLLELSLQLDTVDYPQYIQVMDNFHYSEEGLLQIWNQSVSSTLINPNELSDLVLTYSIGDSLPTEIEYNSPALVAELMRGQIRRLQVTADTIDLLGRSTLASQYDVYCDGRFTENRDFVSRTWIAHVSGYCDHYELRGSYNTVLQDAQFVSQYGLTLSNDKQDASTVTAPAIVGAHFIDGDGTVTVSPSQDGAKFVLTTLDYSDIQNVVIEAKSIGAWDSLPVTFDEFTSVRDRYLVTLPMIDKAAVGYIRVVATDAQGHTASLNFNGAYTIGQDQSQVFTQDTDQDGTPDYIDEDDDNDGVLDLEDALTLNANEWLDSDNDGLGDNTDNDDDGDGFNDDIDCAPLDAELNQSCLSAELTDFDGDGHGDILYRNNNDASWRIQHISQSYEVSQTELDGFSTNASWEFNGVGDFDGDGNQDVLIRNSSSGQWYMYNLENSDVQSRGYVLLESAKNVAVQAVADFNNDGKSDVLLRNQVTGEWQINLLSNKTVTEVIYPPMSKVTSWKLVAAQDFDGNGSPDILIRNQGSNAWYLYLYDNTEIVKRGYHNNVEASAEDEVLASGDFNGDGVFDLLVKQQGTLHLSVIRFAGFSATTAHETGLRVGADTSHEFHSVNDFNGDGISDIAMRDKSTGQIRIHLINDESLVDQSNWLDLYIDNDWQVQTLR